MKYTENKKLFRESLSGKEKLFRNGTRVEIYTSSKCERCESEVLDANKVKSTVRSIPGWLAEGIKLTDVDPRHLAEVWPVSDGYACSNCVTESECNV